MTLQGNAFPKTERLTSRKAIEALFAGGTRALSAFPLRVVYKVIDEAEPTPRTQVLISVSKRHFKHAVDRNRAKRQVREAWRLNRDIITSIPSNLPSPPWGRVGEGALHIAFIWLADEPQPTALVQRKMKNLLHRVAEQLDGVSERRVNDSTE